MRKHYIVWALAVLSLFAAFTALAITEFNSGIVPRGCQSGCPCSLCDLYQLGKNFMDFLLIGLALPIAAITLIWGGVLLLASSGNQSRISQGRAILFNTVIGLAFAFFGWIIINALLQTLVFRIPFVDGALDWFSRPECDTIVNEAHNCAQAKNAPDDPTAFSGFIDGGSIHDGFDTSTPGAQLVPQNQGYRTNPPPTGNPGDLGTYNDAINAAAQGTGVSPDRIRAIIWAESSGNANASHQDADGGSSYGLMQIRPDTARALDPSLSGLSDSAVIARLQDPKYNIALGTRYYSNLAAKNGGDSSLASAAYNGGPGANKQSVDCQGQLRWQCGWDDKAHTVPNTGYQVTRDYVSRINCFETYYKTGQSCS